MSTDTMIVLAVIQAAVAGLLAGALGTAAYLRRLDAEDGRTERPEGD